MYHDIIMAHKNNYYIRYFTHIKWGKQNDANEFFLALIQTFGSDTRYDEFTRVPFNFISIISFS